MNNDFAFIVVYTKLFLFLGVLHKILPPGEY